MTPSQLRMLNHRYRLEERLGQGAMGSVWKAYDTRLERTVAAKELVAGPDSGEDLDVRRERVRREALALAKVEHPAIVNVHDLIYEGSRQDPWIVMSYVRGRSLASCIAGGQPLGEQKVAGIGLAVLQGLMACHTRHVYHRDVKPANIVLSDDGTVRLVDFGIARIVGKNSLTVDSTVIGTPEFLAPELFADRQPGPGTDLWGLGVTLYCALDGRSPFRAETLQATIAAVLGKNPAEPRGGGELAALVLTMLRKRPVERPDAATVAAVLRRVAGGGEAGPSHQTGPRTVPVRQAPPPRGRADAPRGAASGGRAAGPARLTPLHGMPAVSAAKMVTDWPADRAVTNLLALERTAAARIINHCDDPVAGRLLTGIAAVEPARARRILEMVTTERAGRLLDHMSSLAAAAALSLGPPTGAVRVLAQAGDLTATGVLLEMRPPAAAGLLVAMDTGRGVTLLGQASPATVADILRNVPGSRRQELLSRLPELPRALVARHLRDG
jgi:hypothetical protein